MNGCLFLGRMIVRMKVKVIAVIRAMAGWRKELLALLHVV